MPIKVAVFGYGLSAKVFHLPYLSANTAFLLVGISTRLSDVAQSYPNVTVAPTPAELLQRVEPDLVVITTPNATHAEFAELALRAGCHVVIEKPLCLDSTTAKRLQSLAASQRKHLVPFFNRRWDDDFMALQQLITHNRIGAVRLFHSRFDRFRPHAQARWKENAEFGSGVFWDLAPHLIDQMLQLFGKPSTVTADIRAIRQQSPCADYFQLCFEYPSLLVHLGSSPFQAGPVLRFDVHGEAGSAQILGFDPQEQRLREPHRAELARHFAVNTAAGQQMVPLLGGDYSQFYHAVAAALVQAPAAGVTDLIPTVQQAIDGLCCMEAALQSSKQQCKISIVYNEPV